MTSHPKAINNISSLPKNQCYGCGACTNACPLKCIEMAPDHEGFLYPSVDNTLCNECRICISTCPGFVDQDSDRNLDTPIFYGGNINNDDVRFLSSSGGVFSLVANHIFSLNGVVYGAVYDFQNMKVVHSRAESEDELGPMRKSKYVQSDTANTFQDIKRDLLDGKNVLFTGTPCQVDGLCLFLGKDYDNLLTCDIICHGVPSPGLFTSHFSLIEEKRQQPITNIDFRTKQKGWGSFVNFYIHIQFESNETLAYSLTDAYYALFLANLSLRPCCYQCKYTSINRVSDITMGDFWGVNKNHPELYDRKGTSLILINTKKGERSLKAVQSSAKLIKIAYPRPFPPNLVKPSIRPPYRDVIFKKIQFDKWERTAWKFHWIALAIIVKNKFLGFAKQVLRKFSS